MQQSAGKANLFPSERQPVPYLLVSPNDRTANHSAGTVLQISAGIFSSHERELIHGYFAQPKQKLPPGSTQMLQPVRIRRLRQRFLDQLAAVDGGTLGAAVVEEGQAHVVQAQQVQHRGVDIVDVVGLVNRA